MSPQIVGDTITPMTTGSRDDTPLPFARAITLQLREEALSIKDLARVILITVNQTGSSMWQKLPIK